MRSVADVSSVGKDDDMGTAKYTKPAPAAAARNKEMVLFNVDAMRKMFLFHPESASSDSNIAVGLSVSYPYVFQNRDEVYDYVLILRFDRGFRLCSPSVLQLLLRCQVDRRLYETLASALAPPNDHIL